METLCRDANKMKILLIKGFSNLAVDNKSCRTWQSMRLKELLCAEIELLPKPDDFPFLLFLISLHFIVKK